MEGRLKLHRQIEENELYFLEPFTKMQARIDLLLTASFKDWHILVRWNIIEVKRWQNWYAEDTLAKRWKWSRDKVRRYLNYLETIQQIIQQKSKVKSIITIINYEKYQWNDTTDDTTDKQQTIQQTNTIKKYNNVKEWKEVNYWFSDTIETLIKEYDKWRKKKLEKLTERWLGMFIEQLKKLWWSEEWIKQILEQSIRNWWEWIFEVKWVKKKKELTEIEIGNLRFQKSKPEVKQYIDEYKLEDIYTQDQLEWFRKKYLYFVVNQNNG